VVAGGKDGSFMTCVEYENGFTVCFTDPMEKEVLHTETKWCFGCRKHLDYFWTVWTPKEFSYYGPHSAWVCSRCGNDRTLFGDREYEQADY